MNAYTVRSMLYHAGFINENGWDKRPIHQQEDNFKILVELIALECAVICCLEADSHDMAFGRHCSVVIKEHFGVNE